MYLSLIVGCETLRCRIQFNASAQDLGYYIKTDICEGIEFNLK